MEASVDRGIKYFSELATYRKFFTLPKGAKLGHPLWLDLGSVHELAEVRVNGTVVGITWHAPFRLSIGGAVKPGANSLEVRVANLWINRHCWGSNPQVHTASGGRLIRIASMLPPVLSPNSVPRS